MFSWRRRNIVFAISVSSAQAGGGPMAERKMSTPKVLAALAAAAAIGLVGLMALGGSREDAATPAEANAAIPENGAAR
jgi:hypothetical protein